MKSTYRMAKSPRNSYSTYKMNNEKGMMQKNTTRQQNGLADRSWRIDMYHLQHLTILCGLIAACIIMGAFASQAYGAGGDPVWQYDHVLANDQEAKSVVVDPAGYIIITGYSLNTTEDFVTLKVKADGSGKLWDSVYDYNNANTSNDRAIAAAVDSAGHVIVTGQVNNGVNTDIHTIKYNGATGAVIWQNTYNGPSNGHEYPLAITVDDLDNVFVAGKSQNGSGDFDGLVLKYSPIGPNPDGTPIWDVTYDGSVGSRNDEWTDVAAKAGAIAVTGTTHNGTDIDIVTLKYNLDSTAAWAGGPVIHDSGSGDDHGSYVALDGSGNVIVTGHTGDGSSADMYTVKYNSADGSEAWSTPYSTTAGTYPDEPRGLTIDSSGDVYMTGLTYTLSGAQDFYTVRYDGSDGALNWEMIYNSSNGNVDIPSGIVVDEAGAVFVSGSTHKDAAGDDDWTTIKYLKDKGHAGAPYTTTELWVVPFNGAAGDDDRAVGLGLATSGDLFVGGWSDTDAADPATNFNYHAIKYDPGNLNAPTLLTATTVSDTAIDLGWSDNASNEDGFKIFRRKDSEPDFTEIDTVLAGVESYNDIGLDSHIWYHYKVQAYITGPPLEASHFSNEADALATQASFVAPAWFYLYNSTDSGHDEANAIAVGPDNNPVATGSTQTAANGTLVSYDYHTVKIDRTDHTAMWSACYNDSNDEMNMAVCVAVDNNNEVIVSGQSKLPWEGSPATNDVYTRKYLSIGPDDGPPNYGDKYIWSDQYNGPSGDDDRSESIDASTDGNNNVVVTGYGKNGAGNNDIYLIKYDPAVDPENAWKGKRIWTATPYDRGGDDRPAAVVFDQNGDVIVTGKSHNGTDFDVWTRKVDGATGVPIWTAIHDSSNGTDPAWDEARSLAVDSNGDVYVVGVVVNDAGTAGIPGDDHDDWYIVKYDGDTANPNGFVLWSDTFDGPQGGDDIVESVKVDPNDDAIIVGGTILQTVGNNDFHVRRYLSDGTPDWTRTLERVGNDDNVTTMSMDVSGNVCVAGNTDDAAHIDLLAIKYDYGGNILGGTRYDDVDSSDAHASVTNLYGEQFIAGYTTDTTSGDTDFLVLMCEGSVVQAPSPFKAIPHYTSVDLTWVDNNLADDGFYVERQLGACDAAGFWQHIYTAGAGESSYTDEGVNINSIYCYRMQSYVGGGGTSRWLEQEVTTTDPLPPSGLGSTVLNTSDIELRWTDTTTTESGFTIKRCTGAGCNLDLDCSDASITCFYPLAGDEVFIDDTGCDGQTYNYRIQANRTGKWNTAFVDFTANLQTNNLQAPDALNVFDFYQQTVELAWNDNSNDEYEFLLERCQGTAAECGATATYAQIGTLSTIYGNVLLLGMNEAAWDTTPGQVIDASGSGNDGTSAGNATTGDNGKYERRGELDGSGDYITTPLAINQSATSVGVTMMAWVYPLSDSADNHYLFSTENGSVGFENYNWGLLRNGATWQVDNGTATFNTAVSVDMNQWQHLAIVFEPTGIRFYKNGIEVADNTIGFHDAPGDFTIGRRGTLNQEFFDGYLDEVAVYDQPLSQLQVQELMGRSVFEAGKARYQDVNAGMVYDLPYTYQVRAHKVTGNCEWWTLYTNEMEMTAAPPPPTGINAVAEDSTRVSVSWTDNTAGEDGFTLERCTGSGCNSGFVTISDTIAPGATAYVDDTACGAETYNYQVAAVKAATWTSLPGSRSEVVTLAKGEALASLSILDVFEEQIDLEWTYANNDLQGFEIGTCIGDAPPAACNNDADYGYPDGPYKTVSLLPNNNIALWQLDGVTWNGTADEVFDSSGNSNHGVTYNGVTSVSPGKYGSGAAEFDGIDDYITTGVNIDQSSASTGVTFEAWVYPTVSDGIYKYVVSTEDTSSGWDWGFFYLWGNWYVTNGNTTWYATSVGTLSTWYHIVVVFEPGVGVRFYKNGSEYSTTSIVMDDVGDANVTIGREGNLDRRYFKGRIDEVVIYERPLTKAEVSDRYQMKTHYFLNGLTPNTKYNVRVWPYKNSSCPGEWNGPWSLVSATTDDIVNLAPSSFTDTLVNTTQVDLAWDDIASSETGYRLERCAGDYAYCCPAGICDDARFTDDVRDLSAGTTSHSDTTVCDGLDYTYRVRADKNDGPIWNSAWGVYTVSTAPATPPGITLNVLSESEIGISWTDNTPDEEQFILKRCAGLGTACDDDVEFTDTLLTMDGSVAGTKSLHYRMNEAAWNNTAGDVLDISGLDNHGQPFNDATTVDPGKYDLGGYFDGINDYVLTPLNIDQSTGSPGATFEAWVNPTAASGWRAVISTENSGRDWGIMHIGDTWYISTGENWRSVTTGALGGWQHIAAVFIPGVGTKFYRNGVEFSLSYIGYDTSDTNITIGRYGGSNNYFFEGDIDEVIVYEYPLSASEINGHYLSEVDRFEFVDTGLNAGADYTYRITATKTTALPACNWPAFSDAAEQTMSPPAPTDLAVGGDTTNAELSWTDNSGSETGYRLERCDADTFACTLDAHFTVGWDLPPNNTADPNTTYTDTTVCAGDNFSYRVKAVQSPGWGSTGWDGPVNRVIPTPQPPTINSVTQVSEVQIDVRWDADQTTDETGFTIERCIGASCVPVSVGPGSGEALFEDIELTPNTFYTYKVRADKTAACGWPTAYSVAVPADTTPFAPGINNGGINDTTSIHFTWSDTSHTGTGSVIARCTGGPGCSSFTDIGQVDRGITEFTDTTVCNGQQYTYKVKAIGEGLSFNGGGDWTRRAPVNFTGFPPNSPVEIIINQADFAGMQADFSDIRFYDETAKQELTDFWFQENASGTARVWLMTGNNDSIYLYYGNPLAADASSTDEPFVEVYDDFQGTDIDPAKWAEIDVAGNRVRLDSNDLYFDASDTNVRGWNKGVISANSYERVTGNEIYIDLSTVGTRRGYGYSVFGWAKDQTTNIVPGGTAPNNNMMHGIYFYGQNWGVSRFQIWENGVAVPPELPGDKKYYFQHTAYEIKIVLKDAGAKYYVRGGIHYPDWTLLHETSTDFGADDDNLRISMLHHSQYMRMHSVNLRHASSLAGASVNNLAIEGDGVTPLVLDNKWQGAYNDPVSIFSDDHAAPDTLVLTVVSDTEIGLAWNSNTTDEHGFKIDRCDDAAWTCGIIPDASFTGGAGVTTYTDSTMASSVTATYRVYAQKDTGYCSWDSDFAEATTASAAGAPDGLTATLINCFQIELGWNDNGFDENGYEIDMQVWNGYYSQVGVTDANATDFLVKGGIEPGKDYRFRIRSYRGTAPDKSDYVYSAYSYIDTGQTPGYTAADGECVP